MAVANPIIMPPSHKGLTRRALLGGLPFAGAALTLPYPMMAAPASIPPPEDNVAPHPLLALPFVRETTKAERMAGAAPRCFWSVVPTGTYGTDCGTGGRYAQAALDYMVREQAPYLLQWAVFDMIRQGRPHSGIEVGFMSFFGRLATGAQAIRMSHGEGDLT